MLQEETNRVLYKERTEYVLTPNKNINTHTQKRTNTKNCGCVNFRSPLTKTAQSLRSTKQNLSWAIILNPNLYTNAVFFRTLKYKRHFLS